MTRECNRTSVRVVEAIADATNTDVLDLQPPLYDAIDPSALDQLVTGAESVSVQFDYQGHTITVRGDGTVAVDGRVYD
ncbi:HalOD1 output domain-containing protein [Halosolutus amylolyticus]|uniref:HalOD1 output domain-containing protein n=1 Tax=Halosolutus amylolyticus TaxID=2932267 RepID=A0ABD5PL55_9EURY|nr:HalOD1 output domain-containing protein [Halosolutus amylolyticus]